MRREISWGKLWFDVEMDGKGGQKKKKILSIISSNLSTPLSYNSNLTTKTIGQSTALPRNHAMVTYVWIRWFDASLKRAQGTDALNMERWSLEMRVVKLWRLHSDSNTDKDSQRQNEPPAAWHYRPLDQLPHWYWQHCVTHTLATNNNLTAVWCCFDPWGGVLFYSWAHSAD